MAKRSAPLPDLLPVTPPPRKRTPAPPWVAFASAWIGLLSMLGCFAIPFVPGSRRPVDELTHARPYAPADWLLMISLYATVVAMFLGGIVLRQMKTEPRPLPDAMVMHRVQAWVGIALGLAGAAFVYAFVRYQQSH